LESSSQAAKSAGLVLSLLLPDSDTSIHNVSSCPGEVRLVILVDREVNDGATLTALAAVDEERRLLLYLMLAN
jgi:hypothetical protein